MLDALMDAGYSLRDAAAALNLSATDLLDASDSAAEPLAALDRFSRQVASLQVLDSRMQALKALVKVCNDTPDLEKKRLAAQAILRFDPWRVPRATGNGGRSNPPRSPRETGESHDDTPTPLPVPHTPRPRFNGESEIAVRTHGESSTPLPTEGERRAPAPKGQATDSGLGRLAPKGQANALRPARARLAVESSEKPPFSRAHPINYYSPVQPSAAALAAAAGHAISVYALMPARAPPLRAAA